MVSGRDLFIGRQRELGELSATLEMVLANEDRFCLISGEPGIGKTRLSEELAAVAVEKGAEVVWGRCSERTISSSFWPWAQVIEALVRRGDSESAIPEIGPDLLGLANIVPSLRELALRELAAPTWSAGPAMARSTLAPITWRSSATP